jgi:hypothetical protein
MQTTSENQDTPPGSLDPVVGRSRQIALEYFRENPEARDGAMKAYHAYNVPHFRCDPKAHNFGSSLRESACRWCGRTREQVRWDELPPECAKRSPVPEIEDVILGEERKAFALLARAEKDVPKLVAKLGMNGETLAVLHHTHGYDPETVTSIVDVPPQMLADYHSAMEKERARSRAAQVKEAITVRTTDDVAATPNADLSHGDNAHK